MNFILVVIDKTEYKITGFLSLKNLLDKKPDRKNEIFDQILIGCNRSRCTLKEAFGGGNIKDIRDIFVEQRKTYSENLDKFYHVIDSQNGMKGLGVIKELFPEQGEDILSLFLLHPDHFSKFILNENDLAMTASLFDYSETVIQKLFNLCLADPKYNMRFITPRNLHLIVPMFPSFKENIFDLTIGNPKYFKKYYWEIELMRAIFPEYKELGYDGDDKAIIENALQKRWYDKQKQERIKFKEIFFTFECLDKKGHMFFKRVPRDIKFVITSLVASEITNPNIHDNDEKNKIKSEFYNAGQKI